MISDRRVLAGLTLHFSPRQCNIHGHHIVQCQSRGLVDLVPLVEALDATARRNDGTFGVGRIVLSDSTEVHEAGLTSLCGLCDTPYEVALPENRRSLLEGPVTGLVEIAIPTVLGPRAERSTDGGDAGASEDFFLFTSSGLEKFGKVPSWDR